MLLVDLRFGSDLIDSSVLLLLTYWNFTFFSVIYTDRLRPETISGTLSFRDNDYVSKLHSVIRL